MRAAFGLGDATQVDLVRIEWPSGIVQEFQNVAPRQFLDVIEPDLSISPWWQEVPAGATAKFTARTTVPPPLNFQWRLDEVELPDATNATLVISNTQAPHTGKYTVRVTRPESGLWVDSAPARLAGPVMITQQPRSLNVRPGSNALFSVVATGISPVTYQWRFNGTNLPNATDATLPVTNAQLAAGGRYDAVVSNGYGPVQSVSAALGILINPIILAQPLSQSVVIGGSVTLSIAVTGSPAPFTFEWRRGSQILWTNVTEEPMSFLTLNNVQTNQAGSYRAVIKNAAIFPGSLTSSLATLSMLADTDGDGLPDDWEMASGLNPTNAADAMLDLDGDGVTNIDEYRSGTDPADPQSCLRVESLARQETNAWAIRFWAASNQTYSVESRPNPTSGRWRRMIDVPAAPTNRLVESWFPADGSVSSQIFRLVSPHQP